MAVATGSLQRRQAEQSLAGTDVEDGIAGADVGAVEDVISHRREAAQVPGAHLRHFRRPEPVRSQVAQTSVSGTR